jgi:hypothetical protein
MFDRKIETLLGKYADTYQQGLDCESSGCGRAAFAYYQKIVEAAIDEMLDEIVDLSSVSTGEIGQFRPALAQMKETIETRSKIALLKSILPTALIPNHINLLAILHSTLSEGLEVRSDRECLRSAIECRKTLISLVSEVVATRDSAHKFTDMMRQLRQLNEDSQ